MFVFAHARNPEEPYERGKGLGLIVMIQYIVMLLRGLNKIKVYNKFEPYTVFEPFTECLCTSRGFE